MSLYSRLILPYLLDLSLSDPISSKYRKQLLSEVSGEVLEIGFGTGLNLAYYPENITKVTTIDPNPGMNRLARKRIQESKITVDNRLLSSEDLPFPDNNFDSIVSTWTLCSIANIDRAIAEIYRVLKPNGKFYFIEHGLSNEAKIQVWQNRLNPIQKAIGDGCHLNRNIKKILENQFKSIIIEEFYVENAPKIMGYYYKGIATKSN
ncbi:MAG: class I SAM-dependent methyltransferase [Prochloraceae cyanobacterium]|nr:class I SAM-dependent methyltransferase [Prochloraceae cyanobacterium]